jgi:hypothetical protein
MTASIWALMLGTVIAAAVICACVLGARRPTDAALRVKIPTDR